MTSKTSLRRVTDRRKHPRASPLQLEAFVRPFGEAADVWFPAKPVDFNHNGIGLLVNRTVATLGDTVQLKLFFGPSGARQFDLCVTGLVHNHNFTSKAQRIGIEFVGGGIFKPLPKRKLGQLEAELLKLNPLNDQTETKAG